MGWVPSVRRELGAYACREASGRSIAPIYCRNIHVSATSGNGASYEDSLSFTRPSFASPGSTMWISFTLGFLPSFARSITLSHEGSGDRDKHYPVSIQTTPS